MVKGIRRHLATMLFASVLSVLGACDGAGVWRQEGASFIQFSSSSISAGTLRLRGGAAATLGEVTAVGTKQAFDLMLQEAGDKLVVVDFTAQCKHAPEDECASAPHDCRRGTHSARVRPPRLAVQGVGRASG
jgi:hypothetical protein